MELFILVSNWMHNGENVINDITGVFDSRIKAQKSLAESLHLDLQNHSYNNVWCDSSIPFDSFSLPDLAALSYEDPSFCFPVNSIRFWNGEDEFDCEDYLHYEIQQRELL